MIKLISKTSLLIFLIIILFSCNDEQNESQPDRKSVILNNTIEETEDELLYSDSIMIQLKLIVDSLNIKHRNCELNKTYFSAYQAKAHYFELNTGNVKQAKEFVEKNIDFNELSQMYPDAIIEKELLIERYIYEVVKERPYIAFISHFKRRRVSSIEDFFIYELNLKNKWVYKYYKGDSDNNESIRGFYFISNYERYPIPKKYAQMIQYADCLVDTNTQIYTQYAEEHKYDFDENIPERVSDFMDYVNLKTKRPIEIWGDSTEYKSYESYEKEKTKWGTSRFNITDSLIKFDIEFYNKLQDAYNEALKYGGSNDELEDYVGKYISKEAELELMRNRIVIGFCSHDDKPMLRAKRIAELSAQTVNWGIFLRSHLDILNDRFERLSDNPGLRYSRQTFMKELEMLDINVFDLLIGISLEIDNPSKNHYSGGVGRIGMALSETKFKDEIEEKMLKMIMDTTLDDYNRLLIYHMFRNYNYHLENSLKKKKNEIKLVYAVKEMPDYLSSKIINNMIKRTITQK